MSQGKTQDKNQDWPDGMNPNPSEHNILPWYNEHTAPYVERFRSCFHYISQEYTRFAGLHRTNWEYENLVSIIVMRDPLERFLASGRCGEFYDGKAKSLKGDPTNETRALFWEYANADCADNYALRVLANSSCVNGSSTRLSCLDSAKNLLKRFTFILDQACLSDSFVALGNTLHLNITKDSLEKKTRDETKSPIDKYARVMISSHKKHHLSVRERLNNDTLYNYLQHQFRQDIALYKWSKTQSIVQC
jgi:hypothetical protein